MLIALEPSAEDAARTAWTEPTSASSAATTPPTRGRPGCARSTSPVRRRPSTARVGLELSARHAGDRPDGRRADDLPEGLVRRVPGRRRRDARSSTQARAIKTEQEVERMRLANEIAAAAMEHVQGVLRPGMTVRAGSRRVAGLRPRRGNGLEGAGRAGAAVLARLVGPEHQDVHGDDRRPGRRGRADAVRDLGLRRRLLGRPHEEPLPRHADARATRSCSTSSRRSTTTRSPSACRARASPSSTARPRGHRARPATPASRRHPICHGIGARAHEPPYAAPGRRRRDRRGHGARDRARHLLARGRRPPARGQLPGHRGRPREALLLPGRCR